MQCAAFSVCRSSLFGEYESSPWKMNTSALNNETTTSNISRSSNTDTVHTNPEDVMKNLLKSWSNATTELTDNDSDEDVSFLRSEKFVESMLFTGTLLVVFIALCYMYQWRLRLRDKELAQEEVRQMSRLRRQQQDAWTSPFLPRRQTYEIVGMHHLQSPSNVTHSQLQATTHEDNVIPDRDDNGSPVGPGPTLEIPSSAQVEVWNAPPPPFGDIQVHHPAESRSCGGDTEELVAQPAVAQRSDELRSLVKWLVESAGCRLVTVIPRLERRYRYRKRESRKKRRQHKRQKSRSKQRRYTSLLSRGKRRWYLSRRRYLRRQSRARRQRQQRTARRAKPDSRRSARPVVQPQKVLRNI
jgi:hypothetical protein